MKKRLIAATLALALSLALCLLYRHHAPFALAVANQIALPMSALLQHLSGATALPLAELGAILLGAGVVFALPVTLVQTLRRKNFLPLVRGVCNLVTVGSLLLLSWCLIWSPLYYVTPLSETLASQDDARYSLSELLSLSDELVKSANTLSHKQLEFGQPLTLVKTARYPELFSALGVAGVYVPWTGETIVSDQQQPFTLPFIERHERAHADGYAREDEANYIAYKQCLEADVSAQYSGVMYAMYYAMEALHDADTVSWTNLRLKMNEDVARDYYRMNGLRNGDAPGFSLFRQRATEAYLRIVRQSAPRSYGDMVNLLLAEQRLVDTE